MFGFSPPPGTDPLLDDLRARWRPSDRQVEMATQWLRDHPEREGGAYTIHLLVNKHEHCWTTDVKVEHLEGQGVFKSRNEASEMLEALVKDRGIALGVPITGGWTRHSIHDGEPHWAVWEDTLSTANQEV